VVKKYTAHVMLGAALILAGVCDGAGQTATQPTAQPQIAGVWRGNSVCTVKNSPCHDETNVYRIAAVTGRPGRFKVTASKILDGKEIVMGPVLQWDYDFTKRTLTTMVGNGHFQLKVDGDRIEGDLTLADETVYRRIHLVRESE
jgi:hypothetical protein